MTDKRWQRVQQIFDAAVACQPDEHADFVSEACGDDRELHAEVESLLAHDQQASITFMRPPSTPTDAENHDTPDPLIGKTIGKYTIDKVIASGGMGTVYEAVQEKPRRIVALKVMKPWLSAPSVLRRFEFESQMLARLVHPNIAQVYEAGTHTDQELGTSVPYFAMEYVPEAKTIIAYAREQGLSIRDRLRLFATACDAVHHGHQKGIIHRDLKPANILVDANGRVKIIDFGVARSVNSDVAITTMQTDVGQILGTLQYMSPEQCEADPLALDMRTDVYSLGVVLFELICGELPYDVSRSSIHVAARVICEQQPLTPGTVDRRLRGNLEAIVLKAMEKDPERRYASSAALAEDIGRHLNREPIYARRPGVFARFSRSITRHPILATLGLCVAILVGSLALTAGIVRFYYTEPHAMEVSEDGRSARLLSRGRRVLHELNVDAEKGISKAKLVGRAESLGGGKVVLVSFSRRQSNKYPGAICAFDPNRDLQDPIWTRSVAEDQMPADLLTERHFSAEDTGVFHWRVFDVFPDRPGVEIVAVHDVAPTTHTALRVYDLNGKLLYQTWMDFLAFDVYWMSKPRLLVVDGSNGRAYWPQRGHPEVKQAHPWVVFAIRIEDGLITTDYLSETPGSGPLEPVWYKCLLPPKASDTTTRHTLDAPPWRYDPARSVRFELRVLGNKHSAVSWVLNADGREVPGSRVIADVFKINPDKYPDPNKFHLGDLPPIISKTPREP